MNNYPFCFTPLWGYLKLNNSPPWKNRVQKVEQLFAPEFFSTLFSKISYQKIGDFGERCRFFFNKTTELGEIQEKPCNFSILHNALTVFAPNIRGPPTWI